MTSTRVICKGRNRVVVCVTHFNAMASITNHENNSIGIGE
ncbi:MAG: hypothetical protein ACJAVL_000475 [Bacteroidia bacterium]|jgi:hypothetical protein